MVQDNRVSSSENTITKKKPCGSGRRKIEIKRIEKTCRRRVAFSKRRKGLFNKAGELCRLCDANIAIIIFSSSGRMFTFGHPSPENVVNRFLCEDDDEDEDNNTGSEEVDQSSADEEWFWWKKSVEDLSTEELEKYKDCLQGLKNNVGIRLEEMVTRRNCEKDFLSLI